MLENIRSTIIFKNVFSHINDKIKLSLIKYNHFIQNKINISLINYKLLSGRYIIYENKRKIKEYNAFNNCLLYEGGYLNGKRNGQG